MPIPSNFPNSNELKYIEKIDTLRNLLNNLQYEELGLHDLIMNHMKSDQRKDVLYIAHALPHKIADFYADFVQGDSRKVNIISQADDGSEEASKVEEIASENNLQRRIYDFAYDQTGYGKTILLGYVDENEVFRIQQIRPDFYFPQKDGSIIFASLVLTSESDNEHDYRYYIQHYQKDDSGQVFIERSLYEADGRKAGDRLKLSEYSTSIPEMEELGITEYPIIELRNGRKDMASDIEPIMPQLDQINERMTQVAIQLLKNLNPKLQGPEGILDEQGQLKDFEAIEVREGDADLDYVTNENAMIERAEKFVERQVQFISFITSIPVSDLIRQSAQPTTAEALRTRMHGAMSKAQTKRGQIIPELEKIIQIGLKLTETTDDPNNITIEFGPVLPEDEVQKTQVEQMKLNMGITSKRTAMKRLDGLTDDEVDAELERINNEQAQAGFQTNPPTVENNQ